jgi:hypothetical protein
MHKIAGTAGSVGFKKLGDAAQQVEVFFRDHPTSKGSADRAAMVQVLNAFLDVSLGLCVPLEQLAPRSPDDGFDKVSDTGLWQGALFRPGRGSFRRGVQTLSFQNSRHFDQPPAWVLMRRGRGQSVDKVLLHIVSKKSGLCPQY